VKSVELADRFASHLPTIVIQTDWNGIQPQLSYLWMRAD
jgi:hypothetical protein